MTTRRTSLHPHVEVRRDVKVAMRDGVRLAADIYRPSGPSRGGMESSATLLLRTPYSRLRIGPDYAEWFARHGYSVVVQDVRGTFDSEGTFDFLVNEAEDGADTLEWIDAQSWSNGRVGTWGNSYSSFTQLAAATQGPSNLRSMIPSQSASRALSSSVRHGGAFELRWFAWALWHSALNSRDGLFRTPATRAAISRSGPDIRGLFERRALQAEETHLKEVPSYLAWLQRLIDMTGEEEFWASPALAPVDHVDSLPPCSILLIGGWYDSYARGSIELYEALSSNPNLDVHLLMGPWVHGAESPQSSEAGGIDLGARAAVRDVRALHLRWFDRTLRDLPGDATVLESDVDAERDHPVRYFMMGGGAGAPTSSGRLHHGGRWVATENWSDRGVREETLFLHRGGFLDAARPSSDGGSTTYVFDPERPVPSIGGGVSSLDEFEPLPPGYSTHDRAGGTKRLRHILAPGGFDQVETASILGCTAPFLPLALRPDVLVFRTEPLLDDLEIAGGAVVVLHVQSSSIDTDFTAKLIDEYPTSEDLPNGFALNLSDSIVRLRYRNGGNDDVVGPDEVVAVRIELYPTANRFVAGHRIRLDISSSNYPRFDVNPNTGAARGVSRTVACAVNSVHHSATYPSSIVLPVRAAGPKEGL